jgi:hypothetical protein
MNATLASLTLISIVVAVVMTAIALRILRHERRRSAARVAALAADIHRPQGADLMYGEAEDTDLVLHEETNGRTVILKPEPSERSANATMGNLFVTPQRSSRQLVLVSAVLVFGAATAIGLAVGALHRRATPERASIETSTATAPTLSTQTLELLALDHERSDDHLTVRGVVRNPLRGSEVDHLTAVVLLFNQQGGFLTSGRAPLATAVLEPGAEGTFVITVPGAADVGRYRVSFRTDDRVVPHVDRRRNQS